MPPSIDPAGRTVIAKFLHNGSSAYYVRVLSATDEHRNMAREYLAKVIQHAYLAHILFDSWIENAPDGSEVLEPYIRGEAKPAIAEFLTDLSESREVIENALRS